MPLIGNDIVDLMDPGARGKAGDPRFVGRVLTREEQAAVRVSRHPDALLWAFWAAKEAAYKAVSKAFPGVSSAPRRYPVAIDSRQWPETASGSVKTPCGIAYIRIHHGPDYVHCVASTGSSGNLSEIVCGLEAIAPAAGPLWVRESESVRQAAGARVASVLGCPPEDVRILRTSGPPAVFVKGVKAPVDISLSHDGRLVAYAFRFAS